MSDLSPQCAAKRAFGLAESRLIRPPPSLVQRAAARARVARAVIGHQNNIVRSTDSSQNAFGLGLGDAVSVPARVARTFAHQATSSGSIEYP
jgi:hypothetical protein